MSVDSRVSWEAPNPSLECREMISQFPLLTRIQSPSGLYLRLLAFDTRGSPGTLSGKPSLVWLSGSDSRSKKPWICLRGSLASRCFPFCWNIENAAVDLLASHSLCADSISLSKKCPAANPELDSTLKMDENLLAVTGLVGICPVRILQRIWNFFLSGRQAMRIKYMTAATAMVTPSTAHSTWKAWISLLSRSSQCFLTNIWFFLG